MCMKMSHMVHRNLGMDNFNFPMLNPHRPICKYEPHPICLCRFCIIDNPGWNATSIEMRIWTLLEGGLYVKRKARERLFLENVEWKMTKVLAVKLEKRWAVKLVYLTII